MTFTFDQAHAYFAVRLGNPQLPHKEAQTARCPFHGDRTASLSLNLAKGGVWNCHACNIGGGIFDFEKRMFGEVRDNEQLWESIYKLTGATPTHDYAQRKLGLVVASYDYHDPVGKLLFQKQRHDPKMFTQRAPKGTSWTYSLAGVRRVLYRLPELMAAQLAFVCEGEKDADNLTKATGGKVEVKPGQCVTAAATCNFDGAGKWKDEYSPFFAGRRVVVLPDNDDAGRAHALDVARSVGKYAEWVRVVALPGLPEKGDVSNWLQSHTIAELMAEVLKAPLFKEATAEIEEKPFFTSPAMILPLGSGGVEWILPGIIHRGAKGLFVAQPKAGKTMVALDLAVALSSGQPWLGVAPLRQYRVAVVSREDGPSMTQHRLQQFARGRGLDFREMPCLFVNTFAQRANFAIDNDADLEQLVAALKAEQIEFCIVDVLNKVNSADENSNTEMTKVMARFDRVRMETGADVAVIHHDSKGSAPGGKKPRGASSIDSWWDWKISINVDAQDDSRKEVFFGSKAGSPHPSLMVQFQSILGGDSSRIVTVAR